jgi:hypothetical protein
MSIQLETDESGNMVLRPVTDWITAAAANIVVVLGIQYTEMLAGGEIAKKSVQFGLTPQQCLELAEMLTKQAKTLLVDRPPGKAN